MPFLAPTFDNADPLLTPSFYLHHQEANQHPASGILFADISSYLKLI